MDTEQSVELIISENSQSLYNKALTIQKANDNQQALTYYTQALNQIQSIDDVTPAIDQLQYNIFLNICDIHIQQQDATLANVFIEKALQMAYKLQQQEKTIDCLSRRGKIKTLQRDYDGALLDYNKCVEIKLMVNKDGGLDVSDSYNKIGDIYKKQGKHDEAVSMYEKSLNIYLSALSDDDVRIADTYSNIGQIRYLQGKYSDACSVFEKSLKINVSTFGDDHPHLGGAYHDIGTVYYNLGKYDDAISMFEKAAKIRSSMNHRSLAHTYQNIGSVYKAQGKYDDAVSMYEKSLQIKFSAFGESHSTVAHTYTTMGDAYNLQGKYNDAISIYEKTIKIYSSTLGDKHPRIAHTYSFMGDVYRNQGKYDDALSIYDKALNIQLLALDDNHPSIADTYSSIGLVYAHQGKFDDSTTMYERSLNIRLAAFDDNHPSIASTYNNIGDVYNYQGKYDDAISMCEKSLKIQLSVLGDHHPSIATTYNSLGSVYDHQGKYDDAISIYKKSLKILLSVHGDKHPHIATAYNNIGAVNANRGKYDDAISYYEKAASILIDAHLENHPNLASLYEDIAFCYDIQNRNDHATTMRQLSDNIRRSLQQTDINNQAPANVIDQSQAPEDDATADLSDQQIQSQQISNPNDNPSDNPSDNDDHNHTQQSYDQALKEKQYFSAYMQALQQGSCKNKVIRAMYSGPECVGKSSIMRVFTQQQLINLQKPTQIADQSDKMIHLEVYKIEDRTSSNLRQVYDDSVNQIVQQNYDNQINNQQISKPTRGLIDEHLSIYDQDQIGAIQSVTVNQQITATTLTSSRTDTLTTPTTDNNLFLQQCRDFFQHYYPLWLNKTTDDSQYAKIWDFGGHSIYHVTHQPFLSGNSIYFLVFNINQNIHDRVLTRDGHTLNITYLQSMQEWLTSIISGNNNQDKMTATIDNDQAEYSLPIVILIASHGDYIVNQQEGMDRFIEFERELRNEMPCYNSNIYTSRIIFNCNPDDNSDATLAEREQCSLRLHEILKSFVESLPFMCNPIPIRWYIMATILHTPIGRNDNEVISSFINGIRANRVRKIMTIQEIRSIAKDFGLYEGDNELIAMLGYLHDLGEIIFCHQVDQQKIVVTDVDWLLCMFRAIIRLHNCPSGNFEIQSLYEKASETGKISLQYINYVLAPYKLDDETKKSIIKLMETYDILCAIKSDNNEVDYHYFVPYLLQPNAKSFDVSEYYISETLYIGYEHNDIPYIPDGIYYCLLSSCLKEWNNTKVELYYQCAKFYVTKSHHYIIIKKDNSHIALQYCYQKLDNPTFAKAIKSTVQTSIYKNRPHDIVKGKLSSLVDNRMPKFKGAMIRYYVRCKRCKNLTFIDNANELKYGNLVPCQNEGCYMLFESGTMNDWVYLNKIDENDKYNECFDIVASKMDRSSLFRLGMNLKLSHNDVKEIYNNPKTNTYHKAYEILIIWRSQTGQETDLNHLITVLHNINKTAIAEKVTATLHSWQVS